MLGHKVNRPSFGKNTVTQAYCVQSNFVCGPLPLSTNSKRTLFEKRACYCSQVKDCGGAYSAGSLRSKLDLNLCDDDDDDDDDNNNNNTDTLYRRSQQRIFIIGLYVESLFTTSFGRNGPSSSTTHIKNAKNNYCLRSCQNLNEISFYI